MFQVLQRLFLVRRREHRDQLRDILNVHSGLAADLFDQRHGEIHHIAGQLLALFLRELQLVEVIDADSQLPKLNAQRVNVVAVRLADDGDQILVLMGLVGRPVGHRRQFGGMHLAAAGIGFAVRGGLLGIWSEQYGFTMTELGQITGGGLLGFGIVILVAGAFIDVVGYKRLMVIALACHVISAVMLFAATPVFNASGKEAVYMLLYLSMFIFAIGNGICGAVINPLTAALYPEQKTHYLNILHAGWPAGLVIGGLIVFAKGLVGWEILMATFGCSAMRARASYHRAISERSLLAGKPV